MVEGFTETQKAVLYVCQAFRTHFKEPYAELTWYPDGNRAHRTMLVDMGHMSPALERFTKRFPQALAILLPMEGISPIGGLQCRCPPEWRKTGRCHCRHRENRSVVTIMLCSSQDKRPSDDMKRSALELVKQVAQDYQSEQKISRTSISPSRLHRIL